MLISRPPVLARLWCGHGWRLEGCRCRLAALLRQMGSVVVSVQLCFLSLGFGTSDKCDSLSRHAHIVIERAFKSREIEPFL